MMMIDPINNIVSVIIKQVLFLSKVWAHHNDITKSLNDIGEDDINVTDAWNFNLNP